MVQRVLKGSVYSGTGLQDAQDSTTDCLFRNSPLAQLFSDKTQDSFLVGRAIWLEEYSGCLFHYHSVVNNYWQDIWGLVEGVICYSGFQNLPWSPLSPGSCGPFLIPLRWLRTLNSTTPCCGPVPTVSSGILTALGNKMNKMFCPAAWTKNGMLSLKTCHGQGRES